MTYRLSGNVKSTERRTSKLSTMLAASDAPVPAPMVLAGWWGDKFNRLYLNSVDTPKLKSVELRCRSAPRAPRRHHRKRLDATAEVRSRHRDSGEGFPAPLSRRADREIVHREDSRRNAQGRASHSAERRGHAESHAVAPPPCSNRYLDIPETVSLLNQERSNNQLIRFAGRRPSHLLRDDKTLPSLPSSVLNVLQTERTASRALIGTAGKHAGATRDTIRSGGHRQLFAPNHRKVDSEEVARNHDNFACSSGSCLRHSVRFRVCSSQSRRSIGSNPKWPISKRAR